MNCINVIGGGLAGCEAAHYLAGKGLKVHLFEMRPDKNTAVHRTGDLGELVCSNSLKSELEDTAQGLLKKEMQTLGSLILSCADRTRVPAGSALAVDRERFAGQVTREIEHNPHIEIIRREVEDIPDQGITIVASGPLTSEKLARNLQKMTGEENLFFYDAVAPSVSRDSLNMNRVFRASRYGKGSDDYYNCPMNKEEYEAFYDRLIEADVKAGHGIDKDLVFDGCMPVEVMAMRGKDTLRYGPMRPVGLEDPKSGQRPYAVVQLRQEDQEGRIYGLVGFQTRLKWGEQEKMLRMIPGLENAEFVRLGVMHRNTYINSPRVLLPTLQFKSNPRLLFAGQITGVEGYLESAATGIIAGINAARLFRHQEAVTVSPYTLIGALLDFITQSSGKNFQPINANFGILPPLPEKVRDKKTRYGSYVLRSRGEILKFSELL